MEYFVVVCATDISEYAFKALHDERSAVDLLAQRLLQLPSFVKTLAYTMEEYRLPLESALEKAGLPSVAVRTVPEQTNAALFQAIAEDCPKGADELLFVYGDAPYVDTALTVELQNQHRQYRAEYSFADGYSAGLVPEFLTAGIVPILAKKAEASPQKISRTVLFDSIEKDINSYDIETLIAPYDARYLRLHFYANSKRNFLLCSRYPDVTGKNFPDYVEKNAGGLRLLPSFYNIEVAKKAPVQSVYRPTLNKNERPELMRVEDFSVVLQKIADFSDDAVLNFSVFGDSVLHTDVEHFVEMTLAYPKLSVMIETTGLGWTQARVQKLFEIVQKAMPRKNGHIPLYWIVALDALSSKVYGTVHNLDEARSAEALKEAGTFADTVHQLFGDALWVQTTRMNENEGELEPFYRFWKERVKQVIIQKYDSVCGALPDRRVADLSPLKRNPCWHLKRDMTILSDGTVPLCREDISVSTKFGNAFTESLATIWERGCPCYNQHIQSSYKGICERCDEYYTFNF